VEDVKTKLLCDVPQNLKLEDVKRSFRARPLKKVKVENVKNAAFVRDNPQHLKVEDAKTKLSCETSLKK